MGLIFAQLGKLPSGRKLKVAMDVDDTVANMSPALQKIFRKRHGLKFDDAQRKFDWWKGKTTDDKFVKTYSELWSTRSNEITPLLSRTAYSMLSEKTDFSFISARDEKDAGSLRKWLSHNYGKGAKLTLVGSRPYSAHGTRKFEQGYDLLVDDSPHVSSTMNHPLAKGKALLLVDKWDDALESRHPTNTAVVANAEHAADLIFDAHEVHHKR